MNGQQEENNDSQPVKKSWMDTLRENKWVVLIIIVALAFGIYWFWYRPSDQGVGDVDIDTNTEGKLYISRMKGGRGVY
jgi:hypothetical protein